MKATFAASCPEGSAMVYKDLPDHALLELIRSGKDRAFDVLFERYFNRLYQYSLRYTHDPEIARELVMDVMVRLWQKQGAVSIENDLAPYLFRSVKNAIFNHWRKKALETIPFNEQQHEPLLVARPADDQLVAKELEIAYRNQLLQLSPQCHLVFEMSRVENLSHAEIAARLDLSVHTVKNHMKAALNYFRKHMNLHADLLCLLIAAEYFL